jgi:hypothetical protein
MIRRRIEGLRRIKGLHFIIIILLNIVIWSGILSVTDGEIIQRDFNFPLSNQNFIKSYYPLWNDNSSNQNIERLPRLVIYFPYVLLAQLGLEVSLILKILIISTFTFLSLSMFLFCRALLQHFRMEVKGLSWISMGCAFILAYSPVSINFAWEISLLVSLAALPLLLYFILTKINSVYFPLFATAALLLSVAHPFNIVMNIIIGTIFLLVVTMSRKDLRLVLAKTILTFVSFIVMFSWFLLPYFGDPVSSVELGREDQLREEVFSIVSDNEPLKIILLERDKYTYTDFVPPEDPYYNTFHYASLASLVGIGFSIFFIKKRDWKLYSLLLMFSAGFIICTVLSLGSNGPLGDPYYALVSESPFGWIIRSPLKFQLYQLFFIVSLFTLSIAAIAEKLRKKHSLASTAGITIIIAFIFVGSSAYGIYDANTFTFKPIELPSEYFEINNMLKDANTEFKVLYYPLYPTRTTQWSQGHQIPNFEPRSSAVPTYDIGRNFNYVQEMLYDYPYYNGSLSSSGFYDFLASVGVKYIIFNNDRFSRNIDEYDEENLLRLSRSDDVKLIYAKDGWYLFEILRQNSRTLNVVANSPVIASELPDVYEMSSSDQPVMLNSAKESTSPSTENAAADTTQIRIGNSSSNNNNNQPVQLDYKRESATKVSAELNASSSGSMLVFAETFDNGWKAYMNGQKVDSVQLNGMINGFPIPMDGKKILVSIEYEPQKLVEVGVVIAAVYTVSFVTVALLRNHITQRISALVSNIRSG